MALTISPRLSIMVAVAALASATLGLELVQTRILSALYYNHVVYLAVTIALMGFGIAGVLVSLLSERIEYSPKILALCSALFVLTMLLSIYVVSRLPMWWPHAPLLNKLLFSYLMLMPPFLCSGTALGLIFMRSGPDIFRFYCIDLVASALACAAFVLLLNPLGASGFVWTCAGLGCVAFAIQAHKAKFALYITLGFPALIIALYLMYGATLVNNRPEPYKTLGVHMGNGAKVHRTEWTPITRLDVINVPRSRHMMITQDSDAHTPMYPPHAVGGMIAAANRGEPFRGSVTFLYTMRFQPPEESLVIGVGGGVDIISSHAFGAKRTTGVEINPITVKLTTQDYADYLVWPKWPDVKIVAEEGRHFVRSHPNTYDTITMSGIDTFSALNSGAYVLSENYLYTTEAFEDYLKALKPDGMMMINRWFEALPPRESLRLASLYVDAAERMGIEYPEECIFVVVDGDWASTFIKKTPFTRYEILRAFSQIENTRMRVIYLPKIFPEQEQAAIEHRISLGKLPAYNNASNAYENVINPKSDEAKKTFLKAYPLDVSPVYDDRPFFFEYHKGVSLRDWVSGGIHVRPNVNNSLYFLLLACVIISLTAIITPLVVFSRQGLKTRGAPWLMLYFSCLGLGFMLVEIGMMQRLSLYLGDPMHSMLVVLSGLLLFAGGGSYLSGRSNIPQRKLFLLGTKGSMAVVLLWIVVMPMAISLTQEMSFMVRVMITLISLLPVGIILGIPFATGLNYLEAYGPRFVPWAWGINGLTSVLASILAIIFAMKIGFTAVLIIGAFIYLLGWVAISRHSMRNA